MELSKNKIIFFVIIWILWIGILYGAWKLWKTDTEKTNVPKELKVWILENDSHGYDGVIEAFKKANPEYKNTKIVIENQWNYSTYAEYEKMLLSTLADGNGPDIFSVYANGSSYLDNRLEPIPTDILNPEVIQKEYDRLFEELIVQNISKDYPGTYIKWIPIWYEGMGVFYNRDIIEKIPLTWNEIDEKFLTMGNTTSVPVWIGIESSYLPNISDIITLFLLQHGAKSYQDIGDKWATAINRYLAYGSSNPLEGTDTNAKNVSYFRDEMKEKKYHIIDLFVGGKIGFILWYPSLATEIEDSMKRAGIDKTDFTLATEIVPQFESDKKKQANLARYWYFAISKNTKNPYHAAKFLTFLTTAEAWEAFHKSFPYYIPARIDIQEKYKDTPLSSKLPRTSLASFNPKEYSILSRTFNIGNIDTFETTLRSLLDESPMKDGQEIAKILSNKILCSLSKIQGNKDNASVCTE